MIKYYKTNSGETKTVMLDKSTFNIETYPIIFTDLPDLKLKCM